MAARKGCNLDGNETLRTDINDVVPQSTPQPVSHKPSLCATRLGDGRRRHDTDILVP